jgi:hypothetical protein
LRPKYPLLEEYHGHSHNLLEKNFHPGVLELPDKEAKVSSFLPVVEAVGEEVAGLLDLFYLEGMRRREGRGEGNGGGGGRRRRRRLLDKEVKVSSFLLVVEAVGEEVAGFFYLRRREGGREGHGGGEERRKEEGEEEGGGREYTIDMILLIFGMVVAPISPSTTTSLSFKAFSVSKDWTSSPSKVLDILFTGMEASPVITAESPVMFFRLEKAEARLMKYWRRATRSWRESVVQILVATQREIQSWWSFCWETGGVSELKSTEISENKKNPKKIQKIQKLQKKNVPADSSWGFERGLFGHISYSTPIFSCLDLFKAI